MKRVLSWALLLIGFFVFDAINSVFWRFAFSIGYDLLNYSRGLFWAVLIIGGTSILGLIVWLATIGAVLLVKGAQIIRKSSKGKRYIVISAIWIAWAVFIIIGAFVGFVAPKWQTVAFAGTNLVFAVCVWLSGKSLVLEDGAPPTKLEELKAKVAKLEAKEQEKSNERNA